jgi:hypothetical protein
VLSGCGAVPRLEKSIELVEPATADQRERPATLCRKPCDQPGQLLRYCDEFWSRGDFQQCPIHIEKQSPAGLEGRR